MGNTIRAKRRHTTTIRSKTLFTMLLLTMSLLVVLTTVQILSQKQLMEEALASHLVTERAHLEKQATVITEYLAGQITSAVAAYNLSFLSMLLEKAVSDEPNLLYGILMDSTARVVVHTSKPELEQEVLDSGDARYALSCTSISLRERKTTGGAVVEFVLPIQVSTKPWGVLRLGFSIAALQKSMNQAKNRIDTQIGQMIQNSLVVAFLFFMLTMVIAFFTAKKITSPLWQLTLSVKELARGNYEVGENLTIHSTDEVGILASSFSEMSKKLHANREEIEEYNRSLNSKINQATRSLQQAYYDLEQSQEQLIEAEKMASLGQLVGGVAHEINTPIGVGVTAASHFQEQIRKISKAYEDKSMTKAMLESFLSTSQESSALILSNLQRTAELVENFKLVSVDQANLEQRLFNVREYIESVLVSLGPRLKNTSVKINLECSGNIEINSYPGELAQVLTNLIINSLIHGFANDEGGVIDINVEEKPKQLLIFFQDNGCGMTDSTVAQIFEPFFTTRRRDGGTGLGLHIVYNIIHQTMKGTIFCESTPGQGSCFIITLPLMKGEE